MQKSNAQPQNKMGVMPVNRLLISMALPMMISMLVQALYNIVDSVYVAQLSQNAFTAVSLAFPIQNIMIAIGSGTGTGVTALISKSLGEGDEKKARAYAMNGIFLALMSFFVMLIFGIFGSRFFFETQSNISEITEMGTDYLTICCCFSFGLFGQIIFERLMQSTGKTMLSMITQGVGAIVNLVLDPILIFGYLGFPRMEAAGAALATVIGQIVSFIVGILLNHFYNREIKLSLKGFKPSLKLIGNIYALGIPSIIMISIGSIMTYLMNRLLTAIEPTTTATAVFGAYFKLQSFVFMPTIGLSHGMIPIIAYNLGAKNRKRMNDTYKLGVMYAFIIMLIGTILMLAIPNVLLSFFGASEKMLEIGVPAFRIIALGFLAASYCIIASSFFQGCGKSVISMFVSITRQLVVLIPVAYILGFTLGYKYVWFSLPIAEFASLFVTLYGKRKINKFISQQIPE